MGVEKTEYLFSYGTLQNKTVQLSTFGRLLDGMPDVLVGYKLSTVEIRDQKVISASGARYHPILEYSGDPTNLIEGTIFSITESELVAADNYEVDDYKRISIRLKSGKTAWVYVSK